MFVVKVIVGEKLPSVQCASPERIHCIHLAPGSKCTMTEDDIATLTAHVQRMVDKSGESMGFDAQAWLGQWLLEVAPALGHRRPLDVLSEPGGLDLVRNFLQCAQSGAYS